MYTSPGGTVVVASPLELAPTLELAPRPRPAPPLVAAPPSARCAGIELSALPSAVRSARHWTADQLAQAKPPPACAAIDDAVLLVSELVTNAIRALGPGSDLDRIPGDGALILLLVTRLRGTIRIEVHDSVRGSLPAAQQDGSDAESGRGLTVIETLSARWGWQPAPHGKIVWCELVG
jgi:anti-sigma regulatory factor (Ser/Thr protein kinase)